MLYDENSIQSLSPLEFTRLRPGVYCGSTEYSTQLLIEIVSNSIDEFKAGHGNQIDVTIDKKNNICTVRDYGQGFLINSLREDGKTILQASFDTLNTSGKFTEDGVYEGTALGLNGIGSKLTNFLSHWLKVESYRGGRKEVNYFIEGVFDKRSIEKTSEEDGLLVQWRPSEKFFTNPEVDLNKIREMFNTLSCLCPGLTITLTVQGKKEIFFSKNGLNDLVDLSVKDTEIINSRMNMHTEKMDMVIAYTSKYSCNMVAYVNTGETDAGPHITQIKTLITREFNKFFKEQKWLKTKEENLGGEDLQEGMFIAFNITVAGVAYDAQTKSRIVKIDMSPFTSAIIDSLRSWFSLNEKDIKVIFDKAIGARKAREAAKEARDKAREGSQKKQKALKFASKLADCNNKDRSKCELFVTEGDSASGNLKMARDNKIQAVIPVRGKVLNVQKATFAQITKNAEIMTLLDAFFGPGEWTLNPKTLKVSYKKIRYGKIIIMSDADVDGAHIKNLFYTFIWNLCPDLIRKGYIYAGVPPLYKITLGGNKGYKYLKNDAELALYQKENQGKKYQVSRMKGLGEMSVDETEETLIHPESRIIKQINIEDESFTKKIFEDLMGTNITPRKLFIQQYGA